jgi:hypothetical protein
MFNVKTYYIKLAFAIVFLGSISSKLLAQSPYYYQLRIYHLKTTAQETVIDSYLKDAYLPALHRTGIKQIGVFKPIVVDTAERLIYVFIPFKQLTDFEKVSDRLAKDQQYLSVGKNYFSTAYDCPPYTRIESVLLKAFSIMPAPAVPKMNGSKTERVYELRSYEAATEQLSLNKIGMFNDHEAAIFSKLNFNAIFYGQVISGSKMPNLMYLTTFNNKADRDQHWKDFALEYKEIRDLPQYQHNVSKNITLFLYPTDYSDF